MSGLFDALKDDILKRADELIQEIGAFPEEEAIGLLNEIRKRMHEASPFRDEPVDCVLWVKSNEVAANDYNPNAVAPPEMKLLAISIEEDGYTQPVVTFPEKTEVSNYTVVDGYHRTRVCKEVASVRKRVKGYLPITLIRGTQSDIKDRIASTIRHNRARGVHGVDPMIDVVRRLLQEGWSDGEIAEKLGMDADEVLRFKQHVGLPELFKDIDFSRAWETILQEDSEE